jgi:DNA polymerase
LKLSTTKDLFLSYLKQLEELGVRDFYWKPPAAVPKPPAKVAPKPAPKSFLSTEPGQWRPSGIAVFPGTSPEKIARLEEMEARVRVCKDCGLHQGRKKTVFGAGNPDARLVLVGEAPGYDEDREGMPFVGAAGQLLTKILEAMHLRREDVFICNTVKCHPPGNRNPESGELIACEPYLIEQLKIIQPKAICAMGKFAAQTLLKSTTSISRLRGKWHEYQGIPLMPTFHPAYLLRNPADKRLVWDDMKEIMNRLGIEV